MPDVVTPNELLAEVIPQTREYVHVEAQKVGVAVPPTATEADVQKYMWYAAGAGLLALGIIYVTKPSRR